METPTATIYLPWSALALVTQRGLFAARPTATAVVPGTLYYATDTGAVDRSNGSTWDPYGGSGGGGGMTNAQVAALVSVGL